MRKTEEERLEELRSKTAKLKAQIGKIEAKKDAAARKEKNRLKVLVGSGAAGGCETTTGNGGLCEGGFATDGYGGQRQGIFAKQGMAASGDGRKERGGNG